MVIEITEAGGYVSAMGHKVALEAGGHAELRRRCLEQIARLNEPPEEVRFARTEDRRLVLPALQEPGSARPALAPPPPDASSLDPAAPDAAPGPPLPDADPPRAPLPTPAETPRAKKRAGRP